MNSSLGFVEGVQFRSDFPNHKVTGSGTTVRYWPNTSGSALSDYAYAIYTVPVDQSGPLTWSATWGAGEEPAPGAAYVGFGNIVRDHWEWHQISDAAVPVSITNGTDFVTADSCVLVAIVVAPSPTWCELDFFKLETQGPGWTFVEIDSMEHQDYDHGFSLVQSAVVNGKPAILYFSHLQGLVEQYHLAVSSTATGAVASDWQVIDLGLTEGSAVLAEVAGGFALARTNGQSGAASELRFLYSTDPASGFSDELVVQGAGAHLQRLAEVNGLPAISFLYEPVGGAYQPPYFAASDAVTGGTWHVTKISDQNVSDSVVYPLGNPIEVGGAPLVPFVTMDTNPDNLIVAYSSEALPQADTDWTLLDLGPTGPDTCVATSVGGLPTVCASHYKLGVPDANFYLYQLTGVDPLNAADWSSTHVDSLGLGPVFQFDFLAINGEAVALTWKVEASEKLGSQGVLSMYRSTSPSNDPQDWQAGVVSSNQPSAPEFVDLNGQPAFATNKYFFNTGMGEERDYDILYWAVYVP